METWKLVQSKNLKLNTLTNSLNLGVGGRGFKNQGGFKIESKSTISTKMWKLSEEYLIMRGRRLKVGSMKALNKH
jgi:hypothetical protein